MKQILFIALTVLLAPLISVAADDKGRILDQRSELEKIRDQVKQSEARLDSLRQEELNTQNQVSQYDEKITANRMIIGRLNRTLSGLQGQIASADDQLEQSKERLDRAQRKYLGDIRHFYMRGTQRTARPLYESPIASMESNRQIVYLAAVATFQSDNVAEAGEYLGQTLEKLDELTGERKKVQSLKKDKEVATALELSQKERREKALEKIRRTKLAEGDRMLTLRQAAEEMERVIARLETERRRALAERGEVTEPSVFATLKGSLPVPMAGKIVVPFGSATDPITRLQSFSPGVTIQAAPGTPVKAVGAGEVAYVGNLRGYGQFIIINHDDQYYTTYAGLASLEVTTGDFVSSSKVLGPLDANGRLKFELRKGREPLDPVTWIRLDSF
jgi:septal ring factor EnvC (AmiA/AmiB activator)